jgi:uncharacterized FAD-dependent dehydrogenase
LNLIEQSIGALSTSTMNECVTHDRATGLYTVSYQRNGNFSETHVARATHIIIAGGRFAPLFLELPPDCTKVFRRIEMGVRISCAADHPVWQEMKGVDPKYTSEADRKQWRTFCCCRNGEIVVGSYNNLYTYSGRADGARKDRSNTGFNLRCYDAARYPEFKRMVQPYSTSLQQFLDNDPRLQEMYGSFLSDLQEGVQRFLDLFP